ncbi:MAG: YkgJ family cysteine cluster protein [Deltaproteobacteria bacterium]|nr:YkgJ family cysteine cluster protein [Deltaproteobacteria bacterium]
MKQPGDSDIFTCRMCGKCCHGYGGTYVDERETAAICEYLGIGREDFEKRYTAPSGGRRVLAQKADGYCVFFDEKCSIHPVKPAMCRQWPYLRAVLVDPGNWLAMAASCPGMDPDAPRGKIVREVEKRLKQAAEDTFSFDRSGPGR